MKPRTILLAAGLFGTAGVILGALGAHSLRDWLTERGMSVPWETASRYLMFHAVALLGAAALSRQASEGFARRIGWAAIFWCAGILLFSGSLYGLAAGGPRWLGPITPFGGLALIAGWLSAGWAALAKET